MKKSFSLTNIIFTLLIIPFLWGCNNLSSDTGRAQAEYEVSGSFSIKGCIPSGLSENFSISRSALPAYPEAKSLFYTITASLDSDSTIVRQGNVSGNNFSVRLARTGDWTLTIEGFSDSEKTKKIFFGSTQITLGQNELEKSGVKIELDPIKNGSGNIDLKINVASESGIGLIKASLVSVSDNTPILSKNFEAFPATISKTIVASGCYMLSLYFYDKKESEADKNLIYAAQETVNVFDNLTTNYWQGGSEYINSMDGTFTVTKEYVDKFARTTFFVQGTGGTYTPSHPASDTNTGTYFDPYATVQKACDRILAINDGNSTYTIYVDGEVTGSTSAVCKKLEVRGLSSDKKAVLKGSGTGRVLSFTVDESLLLHNLIIKGGETGLYLSGTLANAGAAIENCEIIENTVAGIDCTDNCDLTFDGYVVVKGAGCKINKPVLVKSLTDGADVEITPADYTDDAEIVTSASGTLTKEVLSIIKITPQVNGEIKTYWGVLINEDKTKACMKKQLVNTTIHMPVDNSYKFKLYDNNGSEKSDFEIGNVITFKLFVGYPGTEIPLASGSYEFALAQNGNDIITGSSVDGKPTINLNEKLKPGKYEVRISVVLDGDKFEILKQVNLYSKNVSSAQGMLSLAEAINNGLSTEELNITLTEDIDLSSTNWTYICNYKDDPLYSTPFKGTLDGGGKTIKLPNPKITESEHYAGLFGYIGDTGVIQNLTVECDLISVEPAETRPYKNIGVFVIFNSGTIRNCVNKANLFGKSASNVAGICAENMGLVENCLNTGNITHPSDLYASGHAGFVGGICGNNGCETEVGTIANCFNAGAIEVKYHFDQGNRLNEAPGAICSKICSGCSVINSYWSKGCVVIEGTNCNFVAYKRSTNLILGTVTGCGFVEAGTKVISPGTEAECNSVQTLSYGDDIITALNGWIDAQSNKDEYKRWKFNEEKGIPELVF